MVGIDGRGIADNLLESEMSRESAVRTHRQGDQT